MPPWYKAFDSWLLAHGWPLLLVVAGAIAAVTAYLIATRQAAPLAIWLTYLLMP